jgi:hypothetical protein
MFCFLSQIKPHDFVYIEFSAAEFVKAWYCVQVQK